MLAALASSAFAYFTGGGVGSAAAGVSKLTAPTISSATPTAGGAVALTWSASTAPGTEAIKYYVTRDGGEPGGNCADPGAPDAATTCTDKGLSLGTHTYTVTAVWRSWTATSATASAKVTVGQATHFKITAATTSPAVGAADNLTITAKDDNENTVTTYTGSHSLIFSGASPSPGGTAPTVANSSGTATAFGKATALTFNAGVASVTSSKNGLMKIYRSGPASIVADDGTIEAEPPLQVTPVSGSPTKLTLAAATTTPLAGAADDLTIAAVDTYGNPASSYEGSKALTFSGASASPGGNVPTVSSAAGVAVPFASATTIEFEEGVASTAADANGEMILYKGGATSVKVTDGTLTSSTALAVTVALGDATKLTLTDSTSTPSATGTSNLTTTAQDPYGNTVTAYAGSREIVFSGASSSPSGASPTIVDASGTAVAFGSPTELTFKKGAAAVSSAKNGLMRLVLAGATEISASDGEIATEAPLALNVLVGTAAKLGLTGVTASAGIVGSPCLFACSVTALGNGGTISAQVSVTDSSGNTVSGLGNGHAVKVTTTTGGAIAGTPLTIASTGPAVSTASFTYTAPASGNFSNTITAATSAGATYTSATATASR